MPNNQSETRYSLGICELYHPYFHGIVDHLTSDERRYLYGSYLCFAILDDEDFMDPDLFPDDNTGPWGLSTHREWPNISHPFIRNYRNIIYNYNVDIIQQIRLDTGHILCIPKTFWLKLFQRKCKNYLKRRLHMMKNPRNLMYRELNGHFPKI